MAYAQSTKDILKEQAGEGVKEGARTVTVAAGEKATDKILGKIFDHKKKKNKDNSSPTIMPQPVLIIQLPVQMNHKKTLHRKIVPMTQAI
jgi:hypothetical protein